MGFWVWGKEESQLLSLGFVWVFFIGNFGGTYELSKRTVMVHTSMLVALLCN